MITKRPICALLIFVFSVNVFTKGKCIHLFSAIELSMRDYTYFIAGF